MSLICSIQYLFSLVGVRELPLRHTPWPDRFLSLDVTLSRKFKHMFDEERGAPVFPEVASMTTLCPGMSFPSSSATSIIRFAILSFTEPPGDVYSNFPTEAI